MLIWRFQNAVFCLRTDVMVILNVCNGHLILLFVRLFREYCSLLMFLVYEPIMIKFIWLVPGIFSSVWLRYIYIFFPSYFLKFPLTYLKSLAFLVCISFHGISSLFLLIISLLPPYELSYKFCYSIIFIDIFLQPFQASSNFSLCSSFCENISSFFVFL